MPGLVPNEQHGTWLWGRGAQCWQSAELNGMEDSQGVNKVINKSSTPRTDVCKVQETPC